MKTPSSTKSAIHDRLSIHSISFTRESRPTQKPSHSPTIASSAFLTVTSATTGTPLSHLSYKSPRLRLPAELRVEIWKLALRGVIWPSEDIIMNSRPSRLDLLKVCQKIHSETAQLAYELNIFCFPSTKHFATATSTDGIRHIKRLQLKDWEGHIFQGINCRQVRHLQSHLSTLTALYLVIDWDAGVTARKQVEIEKRAQGLFGVVRLTLRLTEGNF